MADRLALEIESKMDHFFATATDEEFFRMLEDCDWQYYAENEQRFKDELRAIGLEPLNLWANSSEG